MTVIVSDLLRGVLCDVLRDVRGHVLGGTLCGIGPRWGHR